MGGGAAVLFAQGTSGIGVFGGWALGRGSGATAVDAGAGDPHPSVVGIVDKAPEIGLGGTAGENLDLVGLSQKDAERAAWVDDDFLHGKSSLLDGVEKSVCTLPPLSLKAIPGRGLPVVEPTPSAVVIGSHDRVGATGYTPKATIGSDPVVRSPGGLALQICKRALLTELESLASGPP